MSFSTNRVSSVYQSKVIRSSKFLKEMDKIIPWNQIINKVDSIKDIFKSREELGWRPTEDTKIMIKMYFLANWYNLSDELVEDCIYDRASFQEFLDINIATDNIPDSTTLCRFRAFLNKNWLQEDIFQILNDMLDKAGLIIKEWKIIDSTIIQAPTSTKNKEWKRDPEMHSTKKGNNYYFGMKIHASTDVKNGIVTNIYPTSANVHDSQIYEEVLDWNEELTVWDSAYSWDKIEDIAKKNWTTHLHSPKWRRLNKLTFRDIAYGKIVASIRAKWEFTFGIIKDVWWYKKTKYKWIMKNYLQWNVLCGLWLNGKKVWLD